jgi:outer membrane protein OmpA-like peptidoglycan-associated protein
MNHATKPVLILTASALALAACTAPDGSARPRTTNGAIAGGILGGLIGASRGGDNRKEAMIIGAIAGATVGGLIGQELDRQAEALRAEMNNDRVSIVNTGSELVVTLPEAITFDTGSAVIRSSLRGDLQALARNLNEFPDSTIDIIGHTDNVGAASFNQQLSSQRANSVFGILSDGGVAHSRMRAIGRGEDEPIASNLSEAGRAQNRRVEVIIRPIS